jgi:WD40 repeat protein
VGSRRLVNGKTVLAEELLSRSSIVRERAIRPRVPSANKICPATKLCSGTFMSARIGIPPVVAAILLAACLAAPATALVLTTDWKESSPTGSPFSSAAISADGSKVIGGGSLLLFRTWEGDRHWVGPPGMVTAMTADGNEIVWTSGQSLDLVDSSDATLGIQTMGGDIRAAAISANGSFIVAADDKGTIMSWGSSGGFFGRTTTDLVKRIAISPAGNLVVVATEGGVRFYTPALDPVWTDNRSGSIDEYIAISSDGSTIITAGGTRLSSHTAGGDLRWQTDVTRNAITDLACSDDCSTILVGSEDDTVLAIDRYGKIHWTYTAGHGITAVGASQDASVIAAGGIDGTLFVLDHGGHLLAQKQTDTIIQPRSIAVSGDGRRIVVADEHNLYGFGAVSDMSGISGIETFSPAPLNPVPETTRLAGGITTVSAAGTAVVPTLEETPVTSGTPKSPLEPLLVLCTVAGLGILIRRNG